MHLHSPAVVDPALRFDVLGPFRAAQGGAELHISGRKTIALIAYLVRRGAKVPRESLMALLWPDSGDEQARASLRQTLSALRRDLGPLGAAVLAAETGSVGIIPTGVETDAARFDNLSRSGEADDLAAAQALWRGEFLEGIGPVSPEFDRWVEAERGALRAELESVLLRLCDLHAAAGRSEDVIATALRLLALDPLQEHVHRRVIAAYRHQRRFDAALRQFETLRGILDGELGITPEPATLDLIREVRRLRGGAAAAAELPTPPPRTPASPSTRPSIAVLPFLGAPETSDAALLGEGIAEEVIVNLSRDHGLLVVSRQSSFHPDLARAAPEDIGARLGVRFVLSGSARVAGPQLRITAHLARCEDGAEIWAESYDRQIGGLFEVQSEIARTVMATVVGRITAEAAAPAAAASVDMDAWRLGLLAQRELQSHTFDGMHRAVALLSQAVARDATNSRALGLLALASIYERWYSTLQMDVSDILPLAEQALALDNRDSRAHCAMAMACLLSRDYTRAGHHYEAGLAANPNDDLLLIEYSRYLAYIDRPEEALSRIREAMRLNPLHPDWYWNIRGRCLHLLGRHAEALDCFQHLSRPAYYHFAYMAACHKALGEDAAAEAMRQRLFAAEPGFDVARFVNSLPHRSPDTARRFAAEMEWINTEPRQG